MEHPNLEGLSLHDGEEGFTFEFDDDEEEQVDLRWCLVGRFICERSDDRNFYGIFGISISSKMTKTDPNTKENQQKKEKASRQDPKRQKKSPKSEEIKHFIAAR
ncbi:hypothetical protein QL285_009641 [Trifolium repens]|nr:hypothetical protein QL285_009641 [Trifolium repens]